MAKPKKVISVLSGKGGTGKTLFTATIGKMLSDSGYKVLLLDLDIFVRGLTILLSDHVNRSEHRNVISLSEIVENVERNEKFFDDVLTKASADNFFETISMKFQACDFIPAVKDIASPFSSETDPLLQFTDKSDNLIRFFRDIFRYSKYDVIMLDCRSGIDKVIVNMAKISDISICVAEEDDVCLQCNTNLVNQLKYMENVKNVYTVINKSRRIKSKKEMNLRLGSQFDYNFLGVIAFDAEIAESFGKRRLWEMIDRTIYYSSVVSIWKSLEEASDIPIVKEKTSIDRTLLDNVNYASMNRPQRLLRIIGVISSVSAILLLCLWILSNMNGIEPIIMASIILGVLGILSSILTSRNITKWLYGEDDYPKNKYIHHK